MKTAGSGSPRLSGSQLRSGIGSLTVIEIGTPYVHANHTPLTWFSTFTFVVVYVIWFICSRVCTYRNTSISISISIYLDRMLALIWDTGLAQSVERQPFKLVVEGSSPSFGEYFFIALVSVIVERFAVIEYPSKAEINSSSRAIHIRSMPTDCLDFPLYDLSLLRGWCRRSSTLSCMYLPYYIYHTSTIRIDLSRTDRLTSSWVRKWR